MMDKVGFDQPAALDFHTVPDPAAQSAKPRTGRTWSDAFAEFMGWVDEHGRIPKRRSSDPAELRHANWLNVQRTRNRNESLTEDQHQQLGAIPGALQTREMGTPESWADAVAAFYRKHGRLPSEYKPEDSKESFRLTRLRRRAEEQSGLPEAALKNLEGIPWEPRSAKTIQVRLRELDEHIKQHGQIPTDKDFSRWAWRMASGTSDEARAAAKRVEELRERYPATRRPAGKVSDRWFRRCSELEAFLAQNNRLPSATRRDDGEASLYSWYYANRRKLKAGELLDEAAERLRKVLGPWLG